MALANNNSRHKTQEDYSVHPLHRLSVVHPDLVRLKERWAEEDSLDNLNQSIHSEVVVDSVSLSNNNRHQEDCLARLSLKQAGLAL